MWTFLGDHLFGRPDLIAAFGLTILLDSTLLIGLGLAGIWILKMRRKGAATQSLLLRLCLLAVLALPFALPVFSAAGISGWNIRISLPEKPGVSGPALSAPPAIQPAREMNTPRTGDSGGPSTSPKQGPTEFPVAASPNQPKPSIQQSPPVPRVRKPAPVSSSLPVRVATPSAVSSPGLFGKLLRTLPLLFSLFWLTLSLFFALRAGAILLYIDRIRRVSRSARPEHAALAGEVAGELGMDAPPILRSSYVTSALLVGILHPAILLPDRGDENPMAVREVFLHEFAHLARRDPLWLHLCILTRILMPFQPLLWLLSRRIEELSDYACDDFVIHHTGSQRSYATLLLELAESCRPRGMEFTAGSGMLSSPYPLVRRIERILNTSYSRYVAVSANEVMSFSVLFLCAVTLTGFIGFRAQDASGTAYVSKQPHRAEKTLLSKLSRLNVPLTLPIAALSLKEQRAVASLPDKAADRAEKETKESPGEPLPEPASGAPGIAGGEVNPQSGTLAVNTPEEPSSSGSGSETALQTGLPETSGVPIPDAVALSPATPDHTASGPDKAENPRPKAAVRDSLPLDWLELRNSGVVYSEPVTASPGVLNIEIPETAKQTLRESLEQGPENPVWSPTGIIIAFTGSRGRGIWAVPVSGGKPVLLLDNVRDASTPAWKELARILCFTPDGRELTLVNYAPDDNSSAVAKSAAEADAPVPVIANVNLSTGTRRVIAEGAIDGCWSRDGRSFVYVESDRSGIRVLDTVTGKRRILSSSGFSPTLTSDGAAVIYVDQSGLSSNQLFRVPLDGGIPEQLTGDGNWWEPECSPDGEWVLSTGNDAARFDATLNFRAFNLVDQRTYDVLIFRDDSTGIGSWSPSGRQFCYTRSQGEFVNGYNIRRSAIHIEDFSLGSVSKKTETTKPLAFKLNGNFPNPFNPSTTIQFSLPSTVSVELAVYNIMGQKIRELVNGRMEAGTHSVIWNGRDRENKPVSSGTYVARLRMEGKVEAHRMTLVK